MAYRGFREYMEDKNRKLRIQETTNCNSDQNAQCLSDLMLYVNGYIGSMTFVEFKKLVLKHGGSVREHYSKSITHVIATQMCDSKIKNLRRPVVKPEWIFDSIKAERLLKHHKYLLFHNIEENQRQIEFPPHGSNMNEGEELDINAEHVRSKICTAPGFIQNYFASSRLHHLSTWKMELIRFVDNNMKKFNKGSSRKITRDSIIMHVDMDCFFASVALRSRPDLESKPVAIAHAAANASKIGSTSDVASCNYVARSFGVKNGMSVGRAKELVSDLVILPYNFNSIIMSSKNLYKVLIKYADFLKAVSCDEAYLDVTETIKKSHGTIEYESTQLAENIRNEIFNATGCRASVGIGNSMLTARLATIRAKPDGVHCILGTRDNIANSIESFSISELPTVGWATKKKFLELNVKTIGDAQLLSLTSLKSHLGEITGNNVYNFCRGIDERELENKSQQSVGVEINWAIRFQRDDQVKKFVKELCDELILRMKTADIISKQITVNAKKRNYVGEPSKFLGCGHCIEYSKTQNSDKKISNSHHLYQLAMELLSSFNIPVTEIRGIGIHLVAEKEMPLPKGQPTINFKPLGKNQPIVPLNPVTPPKRKRPAELFFSPRKLKSADIFQLKYGTRQSQVDITVYESLPQDLKDELRQEGFTLIDEPQSPLESRVFSQSCVLPTMSQIDPLVMKSLPKGIRLEQEAAALERSKLKALEQKKSTTIVKKLGQITGENEILNSITKWLELAPCAQPCKIDIELLSSYFCALIDDFELEYCTCLLRMINRKTRHIAEWNLAFLMILENVNKKLKSKYGGKLDDSLL